MEVVAYIGKTVTVTIDRAMGSKHPKHGFLYPVNYGYIEGTVSPDGEELDAYVLGVHAAVETFDGVVIAIINRLNDNDPKLVVVEAGKNYSDDAIRALTEFQEKFFESEILR
jgi:inorganic pyrophosphatase